MEANTTSHVRAEYDPFSSSGVFWVSRISISRLRRALGTQSSLLNQWRTSARTPFVLRTGRNYVLLNLASSKGCQARRKTAKVLPAAHVYKGLLGNGSAGGHCALAAASNESGGSSTPAFQWRIVRVCESYGSQSALCGAAQYAYEASMASFWKLSITYILGSNAAGVRLLFCEATKDGIDDVRLPLDKKE